MIKELESVETDDVAHTKLIEETYLTKLKVSRSRGRLELL